jgi:hypothetical protein
MVGPAQRGSRFQIQCYVNDRPDELNRAVFDAISELPHPLEWRSPLASEDYREYRDRDFLVAVGREELEGELAEFWPTRGPIWDGLGVADGNGVVLVEAKSYPQEFYAGGCKAKARPSLERIIETVGRTQEWLGVNRDPERWMGPLIAGDQSSSLYQSANRYAHLFWLREIAGVPAWLVHVLIRRRHHASRSDARRVGTRAVPDSDRSRNGKARASCGLRFLPALPAAGSN